MIAAVAAGVIACFGGCAREQTAGPARDPSGVRILAQMYGQYLRTHGGKAPADEKTFKAYVRAAMAKGAGLPAEAVGRDPESLFISTGDGKPLVILYGPAAMRGPQTGPGGMPVVIYEREGVGGRRLVASPLPAVEEVDEEHFAPMAPDKGVSQ